MKTLIKIRLFFLKLFNLKYETDSKIYRKYMYQYFRYKDWAYETSITQVKVFKHKNNTIIQIETHRPGVLIGKAGVFIDGLRNYLQEKCNDQTIKISLIECNLWNKIY